jgi:hypothetical protein
MNRAVATLAKRAALAAGPQVRHIIFPPMEEFILWMEVEHKDRPPEIRHERRGTGQALLTAVEWCFLKFFSRLRIMRGGDFLSIA